MQLLGLIRFYILYMILFKSKGEVVFDQQDENITAESVNTMMNWVWNSNPKESNGRGASKASEPKIVFNPDKLKHLKKDETVSQQCYEDIQLLINEVNKHQNDGSKWARRMWDSYGAPQSAIVGGNFYWEGDFWQCLSTNVWRDSTNVQNKKPDFTGKYCLTSAVILGLNKLSFKVGMCFPSTCNGTELQKVVHAFTSIPFFVFVQENFCQTKEYTNEWDFITKISGVVFIVLFTLVAFGTLYECYIIGWMTYHSRNNVSRLSILPTHHENLNFQKGQSGQIWKSLLLAFSAYKNTKSVFNVQCSSDTLGAIHGIRAISMLWVVVCHIFLVLHQEFPWKNQFLIVGPFVKSVLAQPILMGEFSVDTFFCMSGFLVTYLMMKQMAQTCGRFNIWTYYVHRLWRLTPAYLLTIIYMSGIYPHAGKGPIWPATYKDMEMCRQTFWRNLFYITVYFPRDEKCLPQLWYLCIDMVYYIVTPIIIYPLFRKPNFGKINFAVIFIASFLIPACIIHYGKLASFPAMNVEGWQRDEFMEKVYNKPWCRMSAFLVGMIYGYILQVKGATLKMSPRFVGFGWTTSAIIGLYLIFGTLQHSAHEKGMSHGMLVYYGTFTRPAWALMVGWVIFACTTGYGGYVNSILSFKGLIPISKLSYTAYLVHFTILAEFYATRPDSTYIDWYTMMYYSIFMVTGTMIAAFVFTLIGEAPFISMEKLVFTHSPRRNPDHKQQYDSSVEKDKSMIINSSMQHSRNNNAENYEEDTNPRERAHNFKRRLIKAV